MSLGLRFAGNVVLLEPRCHHRNSGLQSRYWWARNDRRRGLGAYAPGEVGPVSIQEPNGVIDILVEDEIEATAAAKNTRPISGTTENVEEMTSESCDMVPENRRSVYDIREVIETISDKGSVLELRPKAFWR